MKTIAKPAGRWRHKQATNVLTYCAAYTFLGKPH